MGGVQMNVATEVLIKVKYEQHLKHTRQKCCNAKAGSLGLNTAGSLLLGQLIVCSTP